jgi:hypothetical protein
VTCKVTCTVCTSVNRNDRANSALSGFLRSYHQFFAVVVGLLIGSCSFALAQSSTSEATGGGTHSSSSMGGAAGTNVGGTIHTNQGNAYGNSATGGVTEGASRKGQPAGSRVTGLGKDEGPEDK